MNKKVLVTDGVHPLLLEGLEANGFTYDYHPKISLAETRERIAPYGGVVINSKVLVDKNFIDNAPNLKFVARLGSGMEIIDQVYAAQKGIKVYGAPNGNCNAVAEHALGMLLSLSNKLQKGDKEVRQKIWDREGTRGFEIMGKTVGIIGFGYTGSHFAKKLSGMGVNILAHDKYKEDFAVLLDYVQEVSLEEIFEKADILSIHLPLTPENHHYINADFIDKMKKPFVLINTARGTCIKTEDLIDGLKSEKIIGACLDVFENEKPKTFTEEEDKLFQELYKFPNTVLSPHVAGWTVESKMKLAKILLDKICKDFA